MVAFKYIAALYERFGVPAEELEDYYELAAIATVGDVKMCIRDRSACKTSCTVGNQSCEQK